MQILVNEFKEYMYINTVYKDFPVASSPNFPIQRLYFYISIASSFKIFMCAAFFAGFYIEMRFNTVLFTQFKTLYICFLNLFSQIKSGKCRALVQAILS